MGGRTIVHGTRPAVTTSSAASLLRPYAVTGRGGSSPVSGRPFAAGPAAAIEETSTKRAVAARSAARSTLRVPSRFTAMKAASFCPATMPAAWYTTS